MKWNLTEMFMQILVWKKLLKYNPALLLSTVALFTTTTKKSYNVYDVVINVVSSCDVCVGGD